MIRYLDTSAFLKLIVEEEHSAATRAAVRTGAPWSSVLLEVEAHRAGRRLGIEAADVDRALEAVTIVALADETMALARKLGPDSLRTLDALHLATAIELGDDLSDIVTFDRRMAAGAAAAGMVVVGPGVSDRWWEPPTV